MINAPIIARLNNLSRLAKIGAVIGGYIAAFVLALIAVTVHVIFTSGPDRDASSGMHAFGDALLFIFAFGVIATAPTALALYLLRTNRAFWSLISVAALAVSVTGLASAVSIATSQANTSTSIWLILAVPRILIAPLLAALFGLCSLFSPGRRNRICLGGAAGVECVICIFAIVYWFLPLLFSQAFE